MEVICLEEEAFFKLVELTVKRLGADNRPVADKWIGDDEAMELLRIKSKTTLQRLRDQGQIRYTQPMHKIILYDRDSLLAYLDKNSSDKLFK